MPTLTFGVLYCFFVIGHDRRKILDCNVTRQPNALWIVLQLREAWGYDQPHRFRSSTETRSSLLTSFRPSNRTARNLSEPRFEVLGRTASPSDGLGVCAGSCLTT